MLIPILPVKHCSTGRLVFPLCGKCSLVANNSDKCKHRGEERAFHGCWTTAELLRAVQIGYTVVKIKQIWHFDSKSNTIFRDYMRTWGGLKFASSGWPEWCKSDQEKEQFLLDLERTSGIKLSVEEIVKNIPKRTLTKHFLNK